MNNKKVRKKISQFLNTISFFTIFFSVTSSEGGTISLRRCTYNIIIAIIIFLISMLIRGKNND